MAAPAESAPVTAGRDWRPQIAAVVRVLPIFIVLVAIIVWIAILNPRFIEPGQFLNFLRRSAPLIILGGGQLFVIVTGGFDLSQGSLVTLTVLIGALLAFGDPANTWWVIVLLYGIGFLVGVFNGAVTSLLRVPSFITTLGMLFFLNGFTLTISDGFPKPAPKGTVAEVLGGADFSGFWWAIGLAVLLHLLLSSTRWGVATVATGGNPIGAQEAGIATRRIKIGNFMIAAALAGLTGLLEGFRITSFEPLAGGAPIMFQGVAAAVIGGTALAGGSGTVLGALLGAVVLGTLRDGLTIKGISAFTFNMILGVAIIASMILNVAANRLRMRMRQT